MQKIAGCLLLSFYILFSSAQAQLADTTYNREWLDIDSTITISRLPKSALEKVNRLYQKALTDNLGPQQLKCLLYEMTLQNELNEHVDAAAIRRLKKEITQQKDPLTGMVLQAILAGQYQRFYQKSRWQIDQRKPTLLPASDNINQWSTPDFNKAIQQAFTKALSQPEGLKKMPVNAIQAIITRGTGRLQPTTWYELILLQKLSLDKDPIISGFVPLPSPNWTSIAFLDPEEFSKTNLPTKDSSFEMRVLRDYQLLLAAQTGKSNQELALSLHIDRLEWAWQHSGLAHSQQINFKRGLLNLLRLYPNNPGLLRAYYLLASQEVNNENSFSSDKKSISNGFLRADSLLTQALKDKVVPTPETIALQNLLADIRRQKVNATMEEVYLPGQPLLTLIQYQNTPRVFVRVVALNTQEWEKYSQQKKPSESSLLSKKPMQERFWNLSASDDRRMHSTEIYLDPLPAGQYLLITATQKDLSDNSATVSLTPFQVSTIAVLQQSNEWISIDRASGAPLAGVNYQFYSGYSSTDGGGYRKINTAKGISDSLGRFNFIYKGEFANGISLRTQQDELFLLGKVFLGKSPDENLNNNQGQWPEKKMLLFTDRKIFRPGQIVFWKAIGMMRESEQSNPQALPEGTNLIFYLKDAQGKIIDSIEKKLNSFGSCHGTFQLPKDRLTGTFRITSSGFRNAGTSLQVEEYKRPRFTVEWNQPKQGYSLKDSIQISGSTRSFAGNLLQGAIVKYRVVRSRRWMRFQSPTEEITSGVTYTDQQGNFRIHFMPTGKEEKASVEENDFFAFQVTADVTDASGESRSSQTTLYAGNQSVLLKWELKDVMAEKDWKKIRLFTSNLSDQKVTTPVQLKLFALQTPREVLRKKYWDAPDQPILNEQRFRELFPDDTYSNELDPSGWKTVRTIVNDSFDTKKNGEVRIAEQLPEPGFYRLVTTARDPISGEVIEQVHHFSIIDQNKSGKLVPTDYGWYQSQNELSVGDTLEASLSTGDQVKHLYISRIHPLIQKIEIRNQIVSEGNYSIRETARVPGIHYVQVAFLWKNRIYTHNFEWKVQRPNQSLQITTSSFRNPLEPGSREKWTLEIKDAAGKQPAAELMSTLYDASLDPIAPHYWDWSDFPQPSTPYRPLQFIHNFSRVESFFYYQPEIGSTNFPIVQPDRLANNSYELINQSRERRVNGKSFVLPVMDFPMREEFYDKVYSSAPINISGKVPGVNLANSNPASGMVADAIEKRELTEIPQPESTEGAVRKKLQETAFFFPEIYADSSGKYTLTFTLPESLTRWKWMNLAHTRQMNTGSYLTEIDTRKQLMVIPQMPRFLREGDQIELISQIANTGDNELTGQVTLELIDAATEKPVDGWFNHVFPVQYFTAGAGKTTIVRFPIQVPFGFNQPLIWRIKAKAGNLSDGEQNILPVITNRTLVTETSAFWLSGDGSIQLKLPSLLNNNSATLTHQNIQWEITTRPAWYVIKALPYLLENDQPCAEQVWNRIYANQLASFTLTQFPFIQSTLDQWRNNPSTEKKRFEKAREINSLMNKETPWNQEAASEEQQIESLSQLLDTSNLKNQMTTWLDALKKFQSPEGGFKWLENGAPEETTTLYILSGIGQLKELNAVSFPLQKNLQPIVLPAVRYMDSLLHQFYIRVLSIKDLGSSYTLPDQWIQYLSLRSKFNEVPNSFASDAEKMSKLAFRNWRSYAQLQQSQIAAWMLTEKESDTALQKIIPSLLENAVNDSLQGMYWKYKGYRGGFSSPLSMSVQMLYLLKQSELYAGGKFQSYLPAIIRWVLQQKRTSHWSTSPATAAACYALLKSLPPSYLSNNHLVEVTTGNLIYQVGQEQTEAGTGYYRQVIEGKKVTNNMGAFSIQVSSDPKNNTGKENGPVSGAIYWQYIENIDRIKDSKNPSWSIQKKLFRSVQGKTGTVLEPITNLTPLRKGDRITTRLIITCSQPMEFVYLKDMRASGSEPEDVISGSRMQDRLSYYQTTLDTHSGFFFRRIEKGTFVIDYDAFISHPGEFSSGIARLQSLYAPEYQAHAASTSLRVGD